MSKTTHVVFLAASLALSVGNAAAVPYTFTNIADNSGPFIDFGFPFGPSINDSGTVAFAAFLNTGRRGVFTGSGGATTTIADSRGLFDTFSPFVSLNDSGTVAFS